MEWEKELRDFIDTVFKPRKAGPKNLDRELIIDFVRRIRTDAKKEERAEIASKLSEIVHARKPQDFILGDVLRLKEELLRRSRDVTE